MILNGSQIFVEVLAEQGGRYNFLAIPAAQF